MHAWCFVASVLFWVRMMQLRPYQQEACDAVWDCFRAKQGNPLIVLPTGAGKSLVIAELCRAAVEDHDGRVLVLQHRKELIEQNADKVRKLLDVPVGLYSAGLGRKQINEPIILAGIQSCYRNALDFGRRHMVLIDEVHLVPSSGEGMYSQFLLELQQVQNVKLVGLTATPYRTGEGHLCNGGMWSKVAYEAQIRQLIADGYLCPITNRPSETTFDTSKLHVRAGEFIESELQEVFGDDAKVTKCVSEILNWTVDRHSVIVFCSGVQHAEHVAEKIGAQAAVVHGGTTPLERAALLEDFKSGTLKYLCNCDVLTTGFDAPNIDAVVILRATMSAGLFVQMAGRGFRLHETKKDCLILDFGGNLSRHGSLDAIDYGKAKRDRDGGDAPEKKCPGCDLAIPASARECECGFIFPKPELKHNETADTASAVLAEPQEFQVNDWHFQRHVKKDNPDAPNTLRVTYFLEGNLDKVIDEWVCLMHDGFAGQKASKWWSEHNPDSPSDIAELMTEAYGEPKDAIDAAIAMKQDGQVRMPSTITAIRDGRWWRVMGRDFSERELVVVEELPF